MMRKMPISLLRTGMILGKAVTGPDGQLWLNAGVELRSNYISALWRTGMSYVYIKDPLLDDINVPEAVSEETRRQAVKSLKAILHTSKKGDPVRGSLLLDQRFSDTVEKMVQEVLANKDVVVNLADIRNADDYTFYHSINVCILSLLSGVELNLSRTRMEGLAAGALLHDMGKVWIDDSILNKKGSLTPEEYAEIKKHPSFGYEILSNQKNITEETVTIVAQHHERCDGSGYPYKRAKDDIHPFARLVMVADVYDALTSVRPYRDSLQPHQAIEMIMASGDAYDREMTRLFLKHVAAYPVGTGVRLSNGDLGIVVLNRKGIPLRPVVRICKDGDGATYQPFDFDLSERLDMVISDVLTDVQLAEEFPIHVTSGKDVKKWPLV